SSEKAWPIPRTIWTKFHLDAGQSTLSTDPSPTPGRASYQAGGKGATFLTSPFSQETEITGPISCRLSISSSTSDADLFLVVPLWDPSGKEVDFQGALDSHAPVAQGWLRASQRHLDGELSLPWRPYHSHDRIEPLLPGQQYQVDVEIWPTSI